MTLSAVSATLSSLRTCQTDIGTGMDIVTDVAMDLVEAQEGAVHPDLDKLETLILDCARLDREINCFVDVVQQLTAEELLDYYPDLDKLEALILDCARLAQEINCFEDVVQQLTAEASQQPAENMFTLRTRVKDQFTETMSRLTDHELHNHRKVLAFKESIRSPVTEEAPDGGDNMEDEDVAVTQVTQVQFSCPLTTVEMVNPMRNKSCNHHYDEAAILEMIRARHRQRKRCRCPVVGCENTDVTESDLVPDQKLRRTIQQNKGRQRTEQQAVAAALV